MFGISIFMNDDLSNDIKHYISKANHRGLNGIFTSMHIPENDINLYKDRLLDLGNEAKKNNMDLMVDISGDALDKAGFSFDRLEELIEIGVTGIRMDYHINNEIIAKASHFLKIGINASTITSNDIQELKLYNADFDMLEAWHNYYPRPNTGLDRNLFIEKNKFLKENNFKIMAFIPGNINLRLPLYKGLPTLEEHRSVSPFVSFIDLKKLGVDSIYVGDEGLDDETLIDISEYIYNDIISVRATPETKDFDLVTCLHINREDPGRDAIRSSEARFKKIPNIIPENTIDREKGSITIDNNKYERYMGEIQIVINSLPPDKKVNVVGKVIKEDLALINLIGPGQKFTINKEEK